MKIEVFKNNDSLFVVEPAPPEDLDNAAEGEEEEEEEEEQRKRSEVDEILKTRQSSDAVKKALKDSVVFRG